MTMGETNALWAYHEYGGKVPPLSLVVLAYMAAVSNDDDKYPVYDGGHESLAEKALGRSLPATLADLRAVSRAVKPLLDAGAITVVRRPGHRRREPSTVAYRLNLRD